MRIAPLNIPHHCSLIVRQRLLPHCVQTCIEAVLLQPCSPGLCMGISSASLGGCSSTTFPQTGWMELTERLSSAVNHSHKTESDFSARHAGFQLLVFNTASPHDKIPPNAVLGS